MVPKIKPRGAPAFILAKFEHWLFKTTLCVLLPRENFKKFL